MERTPAWDLLSQAVDDTLAADNGQLVITTPPQEGLKTELLRAALVRYLNGNRDANVLWVSYARAFASHTARTISLDPDAQFQLEQAGPGSHQWKIRGHRGEVFCANPGTAIGGRAFHAIVVDDPHGVAEARNPEHRQRVLDWWDTVAVTRAYPDASIVVAATRLAHHDLPGTLSRRGWRTLPIPALAEAGVPDALNREPGEYLHSIRGTTPERWEQRRQWCGETLWQTMYQQVTTLQGLASDAPANKVG